MRVARCASVRWKEGRVNWNWEGALVEYACMCHVRVPCKKGGQDRGGGLLRADCRHDMPMYCFFYMRYTCTDLTVGLACRYEYRVRRAGRKLVMTLMIAGRKNRSYHLLQEAHIFLARVE